MAGGGDTATGTVGMVADTTVEGAGTAATMTTSEYILGGCKT
jgi:hypothetical protein